MKTIFIIILFLFFLTTGYGQKIIIQKENITPKEITTIGGISFYNDQLFLLLSSNILFPENETKASEAKTITQKYQVWDVYSYDPVSRKLENENSKWNTANASPNGFSILDDSTVIYINNQMKLESNNQTLKELFKQLNRRRASFTDPFADKKQHRIYFSSDMEGGKGKMDLWYIETNKKEPVEAINTGNMNTPVNEICPSLQNDSIIVFSSNSNDNRYDICFYDLKNNSLIHREETPLDNEYFVLSPTKGNLFFMIPKGKKQTLWKGSWSTKREENIENISPLKVEEIPTLNKETDLEQSIENNPEEFNIKMTNYFGLAKYDLTPFMKDSLNHLAVLLKDNPSMNIIICGQASPDGPENLNMMLSYYRANEAYKWLISRNVKANRIFRIYGGEYLFNDTIKARMFSIFTTNESDLPGTMVIYPLLGNDNKNEMIKQFGISSDEMEYIRFALKKQLPVEKENLLILPVKDVHIVQKGETIYGIALKCGIDAKRLSEANNLTDESFQPGKIILIPSH
jgi:outer membrane protein OmpA-like peptidoglycan-associated protein